LPPALPGGFEFLARAKKEMDIIVGTAGHIDHGKTALVRALTGTDADRLPEEKQRGITIDIGFAELELEGTHFGFVDVPGHERFVKNMLAGASGIDLVLLVIAADEGVMPQTREHFEICRLLGLGRGIVVLTKSDLADEETLELARLDAEELVAGSFLESAPIVAVSSIRGSGLDELRTALAEAARSTAASPQIDRHAAFLPIDRSFTVKGFGTVVTGTLASGELREGGEIELLPEGRRLRIRGLQTHGRTVGSAHAGQRTAVNLAGIDHSEVARGQVLAAPGVLRPTQIIDSRVEMLAGSPRPLKSRQRVRVHIGTAEVLARVAVMNEAGELPPGERGDVQLRLETPVACRFGDRFILRSYSPQQTIGGGEVLDPHATRARKRDFAQRAERAALLSAAKEKPAELVSLFVGSAVERGLTAEDVNARLGLAAAAFGEALGSAKGIRSLGGVLFETSVADRLSAKLLKAVTEFHTREPLAAGMPREPLRETAFRRLPAEVFAAVLEELVTTKKLASERDLIRLATHRTELSPEERSVKEKLSAIYKTAGLEPPKLDEALAAARGGLAPPAARKIFEMLIRSGEVAKVTDEYYFSAASLEKLTAAIRTFAATTTDRLIDVAKFKEIAGISRKYAIPLLEHLDRTRVTRRAGDKRLVL